MVCKNICVDYKAKKPVGGMRDIWLVRSVARAVIFTSTGKVSDVHAAQQSCVPVQGVED